MVHLCGAGCLVYSGWLLSNGNEWAAAFWLICGLLATGFRQREARTSEARRG